ncbi:hypothetical protein SAMN05444392_1104 [Seinonella peptonophila]|uniref:Uncharacterized protein n=1 Tax=Seinonella peptonophila TaxID=112248 RepID=A0A1M4ZME3_9BACL|nr:hypothetical protein [Seinonella peptonophila]SHF19213.1 hypothetical protein SAMN05444392_1104 [Seinonella peptonophila]
MKKKKWISFGLVVGLGLAAILFNGFQAIGSSNSGYEQYQAAWKKTQAAKSYTGNLHVTLSDNGKKSVDIVSEIQNDQTKNLSSRQMQLTLGDKKHLIHFYSQQDHQYVQDANGKIYELNHQKKWGQSDHKWANESEGSTIRETIVDTLFGNIKQQVQIEELQNGSKKVSLSLNNKQIPAVIQAIGSFAIKKAGGHQEVFAKHSISSVIPGLDEEIKKQKPQLTQDVKIQSFQLQSTINRSELIERQHATIVVTGKDVMSKQHQLTINIELNRSKINQTTPKQVPLNGKKVEKISWGRS